MLKKVRQNNNARNTQLLPQVVSNRRKRLETKTYFQTDKSFLIHKNMFAILNFLR